MYQFQGNIHIDHLFAETDHFRVLIGSASKVFVLVDANTTHHCLPVLIGHLPVLQDAVIIEIKPGEENKIQTTLFYILEQLTLHEADRKSVLVNLGGGVICDIGGFAAAIYKRGIPCINVPTTLLAQIDAAVGGKNGIDFLGYKNMIGTIREPELVFISKSFLKSLPKDELNNGIAEAFKHALIYDAEYWKEICENPMHDVDRLIDRSIAIKMEIAQADPFEKGIRKILNAGHTIGHALEAWSIDHYLPISHGMAVAAGLIMESHISHQLGYLSIDELERIKQCILNLFGKLSMEEHDFSELIDKMRQDKKNDHGQISFSLIRSIGKASYNDYCDPSVILNALNYYKDGR